MDPGDYILYILFIIYMINYNSFFVKWKYMFIVALVNAPPIIPAHCCSEFEYMLHSASPLHFTSLHPSGGTLTYFLYFRKTAEYLHFNKTTKKLFHFFSLWVFRKKTNPDFANYSLDWADNFSLKLSWADSADGFSFVDDSALDTCAGILVHPCTEKHRVPEVGLQWDHFVLWDLLSWWVTLGRTLWTLLRLLLCLIVCMYV